MPSLHDFKAYVQVCAEFILGNVVLSFGSSGHINYCASEIVVAWR